MAQLDWQACGDPHIMLDFLVDSRRASERKLRLFAAACCRRIWHLLSDERSRKAVETAERFADGLASREDLEEACSQAQEVEKTGLAGNMEDFGEEGPAHTYAACAAASAAGSLQERTAASYAQGAIYWSVVLDAQERASERAIFAFLRSSYTSYVPAAARVAAREAEREAQADLLREIFADPCRPLPVLEPAWYQWNDRIVPALARTCYDGRRLPAGTLDPMGPAILADALEEAGCTQADILSHLRGPAPHVRGCWVVDLLTGRG